MESTQLNLERLECSARFVLAALDDGSLPGVLFDWVWIAEPYVEHVILQSSASQVVKLSLDLIDQDLPLLLECGWVWPSRWVATLREAVSESPWRKPEIYLGPEADDCPIPGGNEVLQGIEYVGCAISTGSGVPGFAQLIWNAWLEWTSVEAVHGFWSNRRAAWDRDLLRRSKGDTGFSLHYHSDRQSLIAMAARIVELCTTLDRCLVGTGGDAEG